MQIGRQQPDILPLLMIIHRLTLALLITQFAGFGSPRRQSALFLLFVLFIKGMWGE